jgi:hypothetical protein
MSSRGSTAPAASALLPAGEVSLLASETAASSASRSSSTISRLYSQKVALDDEEAGLFARGRILSQRLPELGQGAAQVRAGVPLLAPWPQKLGELPPRVPPPLGGQVAQ